MASLVKHIQLSFLFLILMENVIPVSAESSQKNKLTQSQQTRVLGFKDGAGKVKEEGRHVTVKERLCNLDVQSLLCTFAQKKEKKSIFFSY